MSGIWQKLLDGHGRRTLVILAVIVVAGFGLRANRAINDPVKNPGVDADTYTAIARSLYVDHAYGKGIQDATDWSPGAPLLYAGVYYATGGERQGAARFLNAILGTLTILVIYFLGTRLRGPPTGLLAAGLVAFYPYFIFDAGRLMSEPLGCLALASAVLAFLWALEAGTTRRNTAAGAAGSPDRWAWALPGVLLGVTALARPEYSSIAFLLGIVAAVVVARRADVRRGLLAAAVLFGAFLLPVLPWVIRDYVVLNRVVPISTGGGKALFIGTYLPGDGNHFKTKVILYRRFHPNTPLPDSTIVRANMRPLLDRVAARYPNLARDAALAKIGKQNFRHYISHEPLRYAGMLARKTGRMWTPSGRSMHPAVPTVMHYMLLGFGLIGLLILALRRRIEAVIFALIIFGITATGAMLLAGTRRNVVLMPLMITLASFAITELWSLRERSPERSDVAAYPAPQ